MNYVPLNSEILAKKAVNKRMAKKFALSFRNNENEAVNVGEIYENILQRTNTVYATLLNLANIMKGSMVKDAMGTSLASQSVSQVIGFIGALVTSVKALNSYIDSNMPNLNMFSSSQRASLVGLVKDIEEEEMEIHKKMMHLARLRQDGEPNLNAKAFQIFDPMMSKWRGALDELKKRFKRASGVLTATGQGVGAGYTPRRFL
tara:strand:+ start:191 stop:799 length:609 start_codon:yes stop_codon:yes gene_type:complete